MGFHHRAQLRRARVLAGGVFEVKRVIICGSRDWPNDQLVKETICAYVSGFGDVTIVHGDCPTGADASARRWAVNRGATEERHPADWKRHGKAAGPIRNQEMVNLGAFKCLAFWDGKSRGTLDMMKRASQAGIDTSYTIGNGWAVFIPSR